MVGEGRRDDSARLLLGGEKIGVARVLEVEEEADKVVLTEQLLDVSCNSGKGNVSGSRRGAPLFGE